MYKRQFINEQCEDCTEQADLQCVQCGFALCERHNAESEIRITKSNEQGAVDICQTCRKDGAR